MHLVAALETACLLSEPPFLVPVDTAAPSLAVADREFRLRRLDLDGTPLRRRRRAVVRRRVAPVFVVPLLLGAAVVVAHLPLCPCYALE